MNSCEQFVPILSGSMLILYWNKMDKMNLTVDDICSSLTISKNGVVKAITSNVSRCVDEHPSICTGKTRRSRRKVSDTIFQNQLKMIIMIDDRKHICHVYKNGVGYVKLWTSEEIDSVESMKKYCLPIIKLLEELILGLFIKNIKIFPRHYGEKGNQQTIKYSTCSIDL